MRTHDQHYRQPWRRTASRDAVPAVVHRRLSRVAARRRRVLPGAHLRDRLSSPPVELFQFDYWIDGQLVPGGESGVAVGGDARTIEEAEDLSARLLAAIAAARQGPRPA